MMKNNTTFFVPWESIHESNPQEILDRKEKVTLKPFLIMQGALDNNMFPTSRKNSCKAIGRRAAPATITIFEGWEHEWVAKPGPQTDKAREVVKQFIARQLKT